MAPKRRLAWLLKQNKRFSPLLDTALKLAPIPVAVGAALALPMLFLFNGFLAQLNQPVIPVSQAGDWIFLLLFSIVVTLLFGMIVAFPALWTTIVRLLAPGLPASNVKAACRAAATLSIGFVIVGLYLPSTWIPALIPLAIVAGGIAGGLVMVGVSSSALQRAKACAMFALVALLAMLWMVMVVLLLLPVASEWDANWPTLTLVGLLVGVMIMLAASIAEPLLGICLGALITGGWVVKRASPDGGTMIASALYAANLGGGRPANGEQPTAGGEICNLGIDERPVLFFEAKGCSRTAAFLRIHELAGKNSLARRTTIRQWAEEVAPYRAAVSDKAVSKQRRGG